MSQAGHLNITHTQEICCCEYSLYAGFQHTLDIMLPSVHVKLLRKTLVESLGHGWQAVLSFLQGFTQSFFCTPIRVPSRGRAFPWPVPLHVASNFLDLDMVKLQLCLFLSCEGTVACKCYKGTSCWHWFRLSCSYVSCLLGLRMFPLCTLLGPFLVPCSLMPVCTIDFFAFFVPFCSLLVQFSISFLGNNLSISQIWWNTFFQTLGNTKVGTDSWAKFRKLESVTVGFASLHCISICLCTTDKRPFKCFFTSPSNEAILSLAVVKWSPKCSLMLYTTVKIPPTDSLFAADSSRLPVSRVRSISSCSWRWTFAYCNA